MNLCTSSISFWVRGSSLPGSVLGASGFSSMAWSHIVCLGSRWDFSSSNTFLCLLYSVGILAAMVFFSSGGVKVTLLIYILLAMGLCGFLWVLGTNMAFFVSGAQRIIGS